MSITLKKLFLLTMGFGLTAMPAAAELNERQRAYLEKKEELVFITQPGRAPFEFLHQQQHRGMNVELAQWMASELGFKIRFVSASPAEAQAMLEAGTADVITTQVYHRKREKVYDFSNTIRPVPITIYTRNDRTDINEPADLENKPVAALATGQVMKLLQQKDLSCSIRFVAGIADCAALVTSGKADALVCNQAISEYYFTETGLSELKRVDPPLASERVCMAVQDGNEILLSILNYGLYHAQTSGTLDKVQAKWLGPSFDPEKLALHKTITNATAALALALLGILLVLIWNRKLRQKVAERTQRLAESEDRLRQFFENSPDAVFLLDKEGHILAANTRACENLGLSKNELLTKKIHDLAPEEFHQEVTDNMRKWFRGELRQCEGGSQAANGKVLPIEMTGSLHQIGGQTVLQLHARDITLRKVAEQQMIEAHQMAEKSREIAEQASRAKSEFLANMSHEIRTPLNGIVGMTQLLCDTPLSSEQKNCTETIQQSSAGLLKIINHVLDISKIEAGHMDIRESDFDLRQTCSSLHARFNQQAAQNNINFACRVDDSLPPAVVGDEGLIEQVLINLLGNALKFTSDGSVELTVDCCESLPTGQKLLFKVTDSGIGIPKEKQASIFEKFTQVDSSAKRMYGGTGLGLAICRQLVELMGGEIGLISESGEGSTFFFYLTLAEAQPKAPAPMQIIAERTVQKVTRQDARILLVEDNRVNQKVAIAILRKAGCCVDAADNGEEALQQLQEQAYDIVLMDCQMPVMDGFEATARIRALEEPICSLPIIAITAHAMQDDEQRCLDAGMDGYLSKPISRQALIDLINQYTTA